MMGGGYEMKCEKVKGMRVLPTNSVIKPILSHSVCGGGGGLGESILSINLWF